MKRQLKRVALDEAFARQLKVQASVEGKKILDFSREYADEGFVIVKNRDKKNARFRFDF
jgi:hypothetical protein